MGHVDKRSISLSPELAAAVDGAVEAGEFNSASEVVRDALRQWKERRDLLGFTVEELRRLWDEGVASGEAKPGGEVMERLRTKYSAMSSATPSTVR
jgi:antitoxin ParD1/3/4